MELNDFDILFSTINDYGKIIKQLIADYDVEIRDGNGVDILAGAGADRSATVTEYVLKSSLGCISNDRLVLRVRNAGDTKSGVIYLYIR